MGPLAAIDMGSNAIRFYVVNPERGGTWRIIENIREPIRLGGDVFLKGTIGEENIRKAEAAFRRFRTILDRQKVRSIRAVATSATREAENADTLLDRLEKASGIRVEVIAGEEEARLVALAVSRKIPLRKRNALIVDLGGGSVETAFVEDGKVVQADSHNFGAVRILDVLSSAGTDVARTGDLLREYTEMIARKMARWSGGRKAPLFVATGGNMETVASIPDVGAKPHPEYPDVLRLRPARLKRFMETIAGMSVPSRIARFGLRPDRADVILPACFVYHRMATLNGSREILVPRVSLKDGIVADLLRREKKDDYDRARREQVLVSCRRLLAKCGVDADHAGHTATIAGRLFDATQEVHRLPAAARTHLEAAALLHDTGYFVSMQRHHKHSFYLIDNAELVGFSPADRRLVACVARYHRKSPPSVAHPEFAALPKAGRAAVRKLSALLRVAEAIDREHTTSPSDVSCRVVGKTLRLRASGKGSGRLEALGVEGTASLFRKTFALEIHLTFQGG